MYSSLLELFINCAYLQNVNFKQIKILLPQNHFTTSIDLKDGYWHVPITPKKRPYLGFEYQNIKYQFRAMPFGLNIAPRIFTKLISHVSKLVTQKGIYMLAYLDDLLIIAPTFYSVNKT